MAYSGGNTPGNKNDKNNDDVDDILSKMGVDDTPVDTTHQSDMNWSIFTMLTNAWWKKGLWVIAALWVWGAVTPDKPKEAVTQHSDPTVIAPFPRPASIADAVQLLPGQASFTSYKTPSKTETFKVNKTNRKNNKGHWVLDVKYSDGYNASYVFWKNGTAEIISKDAQGKLDNTPGTWKQKGKYVEITSKTGSKIIFSDFKPKPN